MESPRTVWTALRDNPSWRRVYLARSFSLFGTWLNTLAILHLLGEAEVVEALPLALVFVLKHAPAAVLGPAAGVVADRFDRRAVMIGADVLSALIVLGFFFVGHGENHLWIYALTLAQVSVQTFFDPAYRAVVPDLVREDDLVAANALGAATWSAMFALGTAVGGLVLYTLGWQVAIGLDVLSYVVSALLITSVRDARTTPPGGTHRRPPGLRALLGFDEIVTGLAYVWRHPRVRHVLLAKTVWGVLAAQTLYLTLLGATDGFRLRDSDDLGVSFLWFCRAVGTGLGPLIARWYAGNDTRKLRRSVGVGLVVGPSAYALCSQVDVWWVAGACIVVAHIGGATTWVMSTVLLQKMVPSEVRGRTFATELGLVMLTSSLSYLGNAALLDLHWLSLRAGMLFAVITTGLCVLPWLLGLRRRR